MHVFGVWCWLERGVGGGDSVDGGSATTTVSKTIVLCFNCFKFLIIQ